MPAERSQKKPQSARGPRMPAAQSLKGKVMDSLDHKEPQTTRLLSQKLGLHQSSVSHTLKELIEEGLAIKKGKSYSLSNVGIIQKNTQEWMGRTLRCLAEHRDFIQSHDLTGIPPGFQVTMGVVSEGREIIDNDPAIPNQIQEMIIPLLAASRNFLVASSILVPEHQITVAQAVREGGHLQSITSERTLRELRLKSYAVSDDSLHSRIELHRRNDINLHLIVTESHLFLSQPPDGRDAGSAKYHNQQGPGGRRVGQDALLLLPERG